MNKFTGTTRLAALASFALASAQAAIATEMVQYDFEGKAAARSVPVYFGDYADYVAADNWSAVGTSYGNGDTAYGAYLGGKPSAANTRSTYTGTTTAFGGGDYHQFSFTAQGLSAGESLDVTSITGDYAQISSMNGLLGLYVDLGDDNGYNKLGSDIAADADKLFDSFTITTAGMQLANGDTATFRFYFGDNQSGNGKVHKLKNITINGTVSIPEPGTYALLAGCFALTAAMVRRRQR